MHSTIHRPRRIHPSPIYSNVRLALFIVGVAAIPFASTRAMADEAKLRIICFGAHPDDCELQAGGTAALWAEKGHQVKFVSVTNGDIGHWQTTGAPLAARRKREVEAADQLLGIASAVLDIHDGELLPSLEHRRTITRLIRDWKADLVITHRPNDYHPDHRYTGVLVQDAAYMVTVPGFCPDTPHLNKNPIFLYFPDNFSKPNPFKPSVVVPIDRVMEKKLDALAVMESQFLEGGANGSADLRPSDPEQLKKRRLETRENLSQRNRRLAERFRPELKQQFPADQADAVQFAEAFEICEYGSGASVEQLRVLFPISP